MTITATTISNKISSGQSLTYLEALAVLENCHIQLDDLYEIAAALRHTYRGKKVSIQLITSARCGGCGQDCFYCAQSASSKADIPKYDFLSYDLLLARARLTSKYSLDRHCLGFSGLRFTDREIDKFCRVIEKLKNESPTPICCSIGLLTKEQAKKLKEAGVSRINHNLNTSASFYPQICSTHTFEERLANLRLIRSVGLEICCGGIVGMGEDPSDVAEMLLTLRSLEPASVPINFFVPIPGTPLADPAPAPLSPEYCLKVLALARLLLPKAEIRCAAGREKYLSEWTSYVLKAADSIFADGYLTVGGSGLENAISEIEKAGYTADWN